MRPIDADRLTDELMKKAPSLADKIVPLIERQKTLDLKEVIDGSED